MLRIFITLSLILLFLLGALVTTDFGNELTILIYALYIAIIPIVLLLLKKKKLYINKSILFILLTYVFFSAVSAFVNVDINLLATSVLLLLLYLSLGVVTPSAIVKHNQMILVLSSLTLSSLVFIPLLINGINTIPYQGIFYNTNSFGVVTATLFTIMNVFFLEKTETYFLKKKEKFLKTKIFFYSIVMVTCLILAVASGSRTSLITCVILSIIGFLLLIMSLIKHQKLGVFIVKFPFLFLLVSSITWCAIRFTNLNVFFQQNILSKFNRTINQGDVLNGRSVVWETILENTGLFAQSIDRLVVAPHNTFLSILSSNGWIPFLLFVLFFVVTLYHSIEYFFKSKTSYRYFPIIALISFIILSMAEIMLYKTSMILAILAIGISSNNKKIIIKP